MKQIAVIGTGIMGHGIAVNFLKNGYPVTVWNRSPEKTSALVASGAKLATSPKDGSNSADIIFEVTANDESSQDVWLGNNGIIAGAKPDAILITSATLSVDWINKLSDACKDFTFFDMPLTGGRVAAESGNLTLLVGGDEDKLKELEPDLNAIASNIKYFGEVGSGTKYKLILNTLQAIHLAGFGEAIKMAKSACLDENKVGPALIERPGGIVTQIAWDSLQKQPDPITFSVDWITKDLGYAADMSTEISHPLLDDVITIYRKAIEDGHGQSDWTKINEL